VGWLGLLLGLAGIACLGLPGPLLRHWLPEGPQLLGSHAWSQGELWMLGAAMAMAVGTVLCRYACRNTDALVITGWHLVIGAGPLLATCLLTPRPGPGRGPFWPAWSGVATGP
jgi:drug/metabolite transporter (DMT)-like permease